MLRRKRDERFRPRISCRARLCRRYYYKYLGQVLGGDNWSTKVFVYLSNGHTATSANTFAGIASFPRENRFRNSEHSRDAARSGATLRRARFMIRNVSGVNNGRQLYLCVWLNTYFASVRDLGRSSRRPLDRRCGVRDRGAVSVRRR